MKRVDILRALIRSGYDRGLLEDQQWRGFADAFIAEAIEADVLNADCYIGSDVWVDILEEISEEGD